MNMLHIYIYIYIYIYICSQFSCNAQTHVYQDM